MTQNRSSIRLLVLLLFCQLTAFAQQEGKFVDQSLEARIPFTITRYGTRHGLPQNQVLDIVPKKNGDLILSTANGIAEYNGTEFFSFISDPKYQEKLHPWLFWHDKTKQLYGSELGGVFNMLYPRVRFLYHLFGVSLDGDTIRGIDGLGRIFEKHVSEKQFRPRMKTGIKATIYLYAEHEHYYVSTRERLYYANTKSGKTQELIPESVLRIRKNPYNGKLYAVGFLKPYLYEITGGNKVRKIELKHGLSEAGLLLTDIAFTNADSWFISSSQGLIHQTPQGTAVYGSSSHLPAQFLQCLYYDKRQECLFAGTVLDGLLKLQMKSCKSYFETPGIGESSTGSIVQDSRGQIFVAGSVGIIYATGPKGFYEYFHSPYLMASLAVFDDVLYAGTWGGGVRIIKNGRETDSISRKRISESIHSIFKSSKGDLWLGLGHGLAKGKDAASVKHVYPQIQESIITLYERRDGTICAGGMEHVIFISPNGKILKMLDEKDGLMGKETRSFYEDRSGKLWIGTYGGGLYCYENNKLTSINRMPDCHLGPDAFTLAPDGKGNLLITSNKGLWKISEKKLNAFYEGRIPYLVPFYFGEESGIQNTEFNGGMLHNYLQTSPGTFWFPSIQGVVMKQPEHLIYRKLRPEIRTVSINDTLHPFGRHQFNRSTHTVHFDFFCANYANKFNLYYQYKLNGPGLPNAWSLLQKDGNVSFKMLPPGKYVFSVRALDGFNDSGPFVRKYAFEILPYFYETTWFRVLGVVLLILGIVSIFRYRYFRSLQKESRENKINHTILELKLKAIQSKMDPHFIFNALNNIIYLLNAEKYAEAEELVIDFSLLLRKFLEKSDATFLSLQEELDIIDLYLLIEQKRYNQQFTYTISIDQAIAAREIPTLLIQPLVENAVKHGISHTDRPCFIRITAVPTEKGMILSIEDNGIGQKRSAEINRNRRNHLSKGIGLVREKIGIMKEKYGIGIQLEVIDLTGGETTGTLSRLTIEFHD